MLWLQKTFRIKSHELAAVLWAFAYFFCLLCSYYILRPVREEMGILGGVENLQWMFSGTFLVMLIAVPLFGAAVRKFKRHILLPSVYYFFIVNLLVFFYFFHYEIQPAITARAFFIWLSVFNLFVVSVFWSFMADLFNHEQAARLFGCIAAGGSAGAILGPTITASLAIPVGVTNLLLISAFFLSISVMCIKRLIQWTQSEATYNYHTSPGTTKVPSVTHGSDKAIGGGVFAGLKLLLRSKYLLGISIYILLLTTLSTFLYFEQAHIVENSFSDSGKRTTVFAGIDLFVNIITILLQLFATGRIVQRFGTGIALAIVPGFLVLGFGALAVAPVLAVIMMVQIIRRSGNHALAKPAREMLFTVVSREEKYKAKNVIDTLIYRGGDAISGWLFAGLMALGLGLGAIALIAIPIAVMWCLTGIWLGRKQCGYFTGPVEGNSIYR